MKRSSGVTALVTAAALVAIAALGIGYLVRLGGDAPGSRPAAPSTTSPSSPQPSSLRSSQPSSPEPSQPSSQPSSPSTPPPSPSEPATPATLDFTIGTFNVLGSSHTTRRGKLPDMASGRARSRGAAALLRRHGADVVGFQELQSDQYLALRRHTGWDFWPGLETPRQDSENSIGWRRDTWTAVERRTLAIPYFEGKPRQMPYVRLRNPATGIEAWFANFHNPANTRQFLRQGVYRAEARRREVALVNRLRRTGLPVLVTGDMNERDSYFCALTAGAPVHAARGGSREGGSCRPARQRLTIDWIFGTPDVRFSGYVEDRSPLVRRTTDHPVVMSRARISVPGRG